MKTGSNFWTITFLVLVVILTMAILAGRLSQEETSLKIPHGTWLYDCPESYFGTLRWVSSIELEDGEYSVTAMFLTSHLYSGFSEERSVAFLISRDFESYDWLYIMSDGEIDPSWGSFLEKETAQTYPGGHEAMIRDIEAKNIDWAGLYKQLQTDFYKQAHKFGADKCHPPLKIHQFSA